MSTSGGKKRGPHARMLGRRDGGCSPSRHGGPASPRLSCSDCGVPGDGLHVLCVCLVRACNASRRHLPTCTLRRSPVMRCVSSQLPAWRAAAAMVTSAGRESASPLKAWPVREATPLISSCRSSCGGACGRGRACGGRCLCVRTWTLKLARSRRAGVCGRGARRASRSWSCCSGSGPPRASLKVACRRM